MSIREVFRPSAVVRGASEWIEAKVDPLFHGPTYQLIAAQMELQPEDDLLEVACGAGRCCSGKLHRPKVAAVELRGTHSSWVARASHDAGAGSWPDRIVDGAHTRRAGTYVLCSGIS